MSYIDTDVASNAIQTRLIRNLDEERIPKVQTQDSRLSGKIINLFIPSHASTHIVHSHCYSSQLLDIQVNSDA